MSAPLPPMLAGSSLAGHYREFQRDPIGLFSRALATHGDVVRVRFFHIPVTVVNDPDGVREVLAASSENFPREANSSRVMRKFIGDGILSSNGEHWRVQRAAMAPHLQGNAADRSFSIAHRVLDETYARWNLGGDAKQLDIAREARVSSFRILCELLFGYAASWDEAERFTDAVSFGQEDVMERLLSIVPPPLFWPLARNRRLRAEMNCAHQLCAKILREGNRTHDGRPTYLDAVIEQAAAAAGPGRPPDQYWARQLMMTLLIVGAENPSNTVAWALALLARHPRWLAAVRDEAARAGAIDSGAELGRLPILQRVVHETLRLYPGGWALDRKAHRAQTLGGFRVDRGAVVLVSPFLMHRNPRFWKDPEQFDPDRFLPERRESVPRFAFFPFGGGPHQCLGPRYAYQIIPLMLARFLQRFEYEPTFEAMPTPRPLFTLRPQNGVPLRVRARS